MPIHLLSAIAVPKSLLKRIESLFANFFWGTSEFGNKKHWVRWHNLCCPTSEEGLGIRKLSDVKNAFLLKQCWHICRRSSIWAIFMQQKYKISLSSAEWQGPQRCSVEWKNILDIRLEFARRCSWTIGKGNISFWYDRWHPEFLLDLLKPNEDIHLKLRDFHQNGVWLFDNLIPSLGTNVVQSLYDHAPMLAENDDIRHWAPENTGLFTTKSAWDSIRDHHPTVPTLADIWATPMPTSAKLICWRIFFNILPVDQRVQRSGVSIASKCVCCSSHSSESLDHLFVNGELAQSLWSYFGTIFAVPYFPSQSITTRIKWWFRCCKGKSHFSIMGRLACIAICRQIWSYRNNSIYGGMNRDYMHARMVVIDTLQHVDQLVKPMMYSSKYGIDSLQTIGITPRAPKSRRVSLFAWNPPTTNSFALNTDGSCRNNQMAIGGVFRDHSGKLLCAYAGPKGAGTSFQGEIHALALGVEIIDEMGLHPTTAFTDSMSLAKSIGHTCPHWQLTQTWKAMHQHLHNIPVRHCVRESNMVADSLSKLGHCLQHIQYFFDPTELPMHIQRLLWQDKMGFAYCRR